jgi:hypothetical protein
MITVNIEPSLISNPRKKSRQWIGPSNGMAWYRVRVLHLYIPESPAQSHYSRNAELTNRMPTYYRLCSRSL